MVAVQADGAALLDRVRVGRIRVGDDARTLDRLDERLADLALETRAWTPKREADMTVLFDVDRRTPWRLLRPLVRAAAARGFTPTGFAGYREAGLFTDPSRD